MLAAKLLFLAIGLKVTAYKQTYKSEYDYAEHQLPMFKQETKKPIGILTTSAGAAVTKNESVTINQNLLFNEYFLDSFLNFDRERVPSRVVHDKGAGAFGYFKVTNNISHICNAKLFSENGKKTPVAVRFSPALQEVGGSDLAREHRGFAVKFYTEDGNFDMLMLNVPVFFLKNPILFIYINHAFKRNPQTNLVPDYNMRWDYLTQNPESMYFFLYVYGDRGIPDGYRFMPGYAIHPFQVVNDKGEISFVKFIMKAYPDIKSLTTQQATKIQRKDLDYATRDLYNAIADGNYPIWKLIVQVMSLNEVKKANFDPFDITRNWPSDTTSIEVGDLVLNQNPVNYFAEVEQMAFAPSSLVPGIQGGVDPVFQTRRFVYRDAEVYRLGKNYRNIQVNCPFRTTVTNYNRDGVSPVLTNMKNAPNYYPNSFNGPVPIDRIDPPLYETYINPEPNNFDQASEYYESLPEVQRNMIVKNIAQSLSNAEQFLQERALQLFMRINSDLAKRVQESIKNQTYKNQTEEYDVNECAYQ